MSMPTVRAHAENGAVVLDEPLNVPDGTPLTVSNDVDGLDDMGPEERAAFLQEIDESGAEADAGKLIDAATALASLRAQ